MGEPARPLTFPLHDDERAWPAQGQWTYADYLRLPDDGCRYEVIRGHLYVTPAPVYDHQRVVTRFSAALTQFEIGRASCRESASNFDVLLSDGNASPHKPN